ncbi:TetR/AcrR family transcriptional regulator [Fodinicola acaciae]|uniref:TetR/AcrR family transcriptional regulator n=1 Tax=Fodinicola acaciae TaxID=2681555 RepID=UPI0013D859AB|nr:TetR/AcrR family transcriptional regulator [Fodinicola acaciae]
MPRDSNGPQSASSTELPLLTSAAVPERADARRNRLKVLAAAELLFAERGVAAVSMDDVAAAAGVGKGTLYRRFGDKGGLAIALLDEQERRLQEDLLQGPPPLGPGAPAAVRIAAFVRAYAEFLDQHGDLVLMSESNSVGARFRGGSYQFWRLHLVALLRELEVDRPDVRAELILAPLGAETYRQLRDTAGSTDALVDLLITWLDSY